MNPDFEKYKDGLIPAVVQDASTNKVLMLGFMNKESFEKTQSEKKVTFYSRKKGSLWTKGSTSGNFLELTEMLLDCDNDTLLVKAIPTGPVCHTGADTCFNEKNPGFTLKHLEDIIEKRKKEPTAQSYTTSLFNEGINKIAQKVGEEAIELVIESKDDNKQRFLDEAADLLFHYLVLLQAKNEKMEDVVNVLAMRHRVT